MIKILVDSSADLNTHDGIFDYFIPIKITINDKEYADGIDIDTDTFYSLLISGKGFPTTSQPSPKDFENIFEQVKRDGDELIYFALSSTLSGTYQGAMLAKSMVEYDGIHIIDSLTATHMIAILARHAKNLIERGYTADEIVEECESLKSRVKVYAGLDTLEYLRRGGRLSNASATVGQLAKIKPVITVTEDGKVEPIGKCLGKLRAMQFITDKLKSFEIDYDFPIYSLYSYGEENADILEQKLESEGFDIDRRVQIGSTIGAHIGPSAYGVIFVTK